MSAKKGKMKKIFFLNALIIGASLGYTPDLLAQDSGVYIGLGVGHPSTNIDDMTEANQPINYLIVGPIVRFTSSHDNSTNNSWTIFGGYQFNRFLAIEALYSTLGEYTRNASGTSRFGKLGTPSSYQIVDNLKLDGFGLAGLANLPITDRISVFGKYGIFNWRGKLNHVTSFRSGTLDPVASTDEDSGYSPVMGFGARFKFKHGFSALAEWMQINNVGGNLSTGTSNAQVSFVGMQVNF